MSAISSMVEILENRQLFSIAPTFVGIVPGYFPPTGSDTITMHLPNPSRTAVAEQVSIALYISTDRTLDPTDTELATISESLQVGRKGINAPITFPSPTS